MSSVGCNNSLLCVKKTSQSPYPLLSKTLQFIHMLTATDDRSSHIKNSKNTKKSSIKKLQRHMIIEVQQYSAF